MRPIVVVAGVAAALLLAGAGCSRSGFQLGPGKTHRGNVHLTVGNVTLGRGAGLRGGIRLQAGEVRIGPGGQVSGPIAVEHGNVELADSVRVGSVQVANGALRAAPGTVIAGPLELTSGLIELRGATVEQPVTLVRGRLVVGAGSVLAAGLEVPNPGKMADDSTAVVIEDGARVSGPVRTEGYVRLIVQPGADVGGAEFIGRQPEGGPLP